MAFVRNNNDKNKQLKLLLISLAVHWTGAPANKKNTVTLQSLYYDHRSDVKNVSCTCYQWLGLLVKRIKTLKISSLWEDMSTEGGDSSTMHLQVGVTSSHFGSYPDSLAIFFLCSSVAFFCRFLLCWSGFVTVFCFPRYNLFSGL